MTESETLFWVTYGAWGEAPKGRACVGGCGLLAAPGDTYCDGCRSALTRGSDPSDWPV